MKISSNNPTEIRLKLFANGYKPIPVTDPNANDKASGKRPAIPNWPEIAETVSTEMITGWSTLRDAANTGIVTGEIAAIDIDVPNEAVASENESFIDEKLGSRPPIRFGERPKRLGVVRTEKPFKKIVSPAYILSDGSKAQVEILCEGQQFVAYGIHPKTYQPYEWDGNSLCEIRIDDLPCVTEDFCRQIIEATEQILIEHGAVQKSEFDSREQEGKRIAHVEHQPPTADLVEDALEYFPNNDVSYDDWFMVGASIKNALGDQGFEIFEKWSQSSEKFIQKDTEKVWKALKPDGGITIGTLFWRANKNGWRRSNQQNDKPTIAISSGQLPAIVDQSEDALISSGIEVFQRGGLIVRPLWHQNLTSVQKRQQSVSFVNLSEDAMAEMFMKAANYVKTDSDGVLYPVDISMRLVKTYLARQGDWRLPEINGIIHTPLICFDGSTITRGGYDCATGIYAAFDEKQFPPIPDKASLDGAKHAVEQLRSLFATFPFADGPRGANEAVLLSAFFTGILRSILPTAPMFGFSSPSAGSGKSLLVDLISMIVYGRAAAVTAPGKTEEEMEKRIGTALLQGDAVISLDNCTDPLKGSFLCQVTTQRYIKLRILGKSKNVELPTNTLLVATGNNLTFADDMNRRALVCSLDPKEERPEERQFQQNPLEIGANQRGVFVVALLTILRAYIQAGTPQMAPILGSFPEWSRYVRSLMVWLGFPDPCETMEQVRENDPVLQRNRTLLYEIESAFQDQPFTVAQLIEKAEERSSTGYEKWGYKNADLHSILSEFSYGKKDLNKNSIGKALASLKGRIIDGMTLTIESKRGGKNTWIVTNGPRAKTARLIEDLL